MTAKCIEMRSKVISGVFFALILLVLFIGNPVTLSWVTGLFFWMFYLTVLGRGHLDKPLWKA